VPRAQRFGCFLPVMLRLAALLHNSTAQCAGRHALFLSVLLLSVQAHAQTPLSPCEQAGQNAERQYALPTGLLGAIGRVESGQWDPALGRVVPYPWAIDAAGQPDLADSKANALQRMHDLQTSGVRNIDVGCFQINLLNHPNAFTDLDQAFDPVANAQAAARFLMSLHAQLGNWEDAVAAYHSATPAYGIPYRQLVFANWSAPIGSPKSLAPVRVFSINGTEIRVWTPSAPGTAAAVVTIAAQSSSSLPRVITTGH
jgi:hypothetical protein